MGKNIYHLGGPGMGQVLKLINNYMMVVTAFGTSEAIAIGLKAGLELERMLEIIGKSSGNSAVIANWHMLAAHQREYGKIEQYTDTIFYKDMKLGVDFAEEIGIKTDLGGLILRIDDSGLFPTEAPG
jgi:3-hydroxyisobutyrate dehydrogenase